jgi:hypothetical protein
MLCFTGLIKAVHCNGYIYGMLQKSEAVGDLEYLAITVMREKLLHIMCFQFEAYVYFLYISSCYGTTCLYNIIKKIWPSCQGDMMVKWR